MLAEDYLEWQMWLWCTNVLESLNREIIKEDVKIDEHCSLRVKDYGKKERCLGAVKMFP